MGPLVLCLGGFPRRPPAGFPQPPSPTGFPQRDTPIIYLLYFIYTKICCTSHWLVRGLGPGGLCRGLVRVPGATPTDPKSNRPKKWLVRWLVRGLCGTCAGQIRPMGLFLGPSTLTALVVPAMVSCGACVGGLCGCCSGHVQSLHFWGRWNCLKSGHFGLCAACAQGLCATIFHVSGLCGGLCVFFR